MIERLMLGVLLATLMICFSILAIVVVFGMLDATGVHIQDCKNFQYAADRAASCYFFRGE